MRDIALLMFMAAALPMALMRPFIGLLLWVGLSYMNPHRLAWGFAVTVPWVMIVAVATMFATAAHTDQRQGIPMKPIIQLMTFFLIWTGFTSLVAVMPDLAQTNWITFLKILIMAYFTLILVTDEQKLHWLIWAIALSFGFWGFKGGLFTLLTGGAHHVLGPMHSFFRDNNDFALVMCMTLPLMRYLQIRASNKWIRQGLWILMGLTVVSVVGTYSRGGFLALAVTLFMLVLKSRRRAGLILVVPMIAVALATFMPQEYISRIYSIDNYQTDESASGRIDSYKFAISYAMAHPITGGGFELAASDAAWDQHGPPGATHRAIHSIFFEVLGEQGFVGLGLYLAMLIVAWMTLARVRNRARGVSDLQWAGDLASMLQVSVVAFVAAGAGLPMTYFDLIFQIFALTALLQLFVERRAKGYQQQETKAPERDRGPTPMPRPNLAPASGRGRQPQQDERSREMPWW